MPCYHPLAAFQGPDKGPVFFTRPDGPRGFLLRKLTLPCGRCIGCRLERARQWAIRCVHESQLWEDSSFVTLTYDNEHLPYGGTLYPRHLTLFLKRLRRKYVQRISYFAAGEYGEACANCRLNKRDCRCPRYVAGIGRPHYHALVFGLRLDDLVLHQRGVTPDLNLHTSETLSMVWGAGFVSVGAVTFESAAYVARYALKKINGVFADEHYRVIDPETGEIHQLHPEFVRMSLKPAIGKNWFQKFETDIYPSDFAVIRGKKMKPPRYYDRLFEAIDPEALQLIKEVRVDYASSRQSDQTPARLLVREAVATAAIALKSPRSLGDKK